MYVRSKLQVKFFNPEKGFGFLRSEVDIFIGGRVAKDWREELGAAGVVFADVEFGRGAKGYQVTKIFDVTTAEQVEGEIDGVVKFMNLEKGFGFVTSDELDHDVMLPANVARDAGIVPSSGMEVVFEYELGDSGAKVTSLRLPHDDEADTSDDAEVTDEVDTGPTDEELGEVTAAAAE